jgi:hypothetical protein
MNESKQPEILSRRITMAGLAALTAALLLPSPSAWTILLSVPVLTLFATGFKPPRKWGGWVAVLMTPYLCIAIGEAIADPTDRLSNMLVAGVSTLVFFTAMDVVRRSGVNLRS